MDRGESRTRRGGRAVAAGATGASLSLLAHCAGGGATPGVPLLALSLLGPAVFGAWAGARPWSPTRVLVALAGGQALAHLALGMAVAAPASASDGRRMLGCHLLGTLVTLVLLRRADAAARWLRTGLAGLLRRPALRVAAPARRAVPALPATTSALHGLTLARSSRRRGPPMAVLPAA